MFNPIAGLTSHLKRPLTNDLLTARAKWHTINNWASQMFISFQQISHTRSNMVNVCHGILIITANTFRNISQEVMVVFGDLPNETDMALDLSAPAVNIYAWAEFAENAIRTPPLVRIPASEAFEASPFKMSLDVIMQMRDMLTGMVFTVPDETYTIAHMQFGMNGRIEEAVRVARSMLWWIYTSSEQAVNLFYIFLRNNFSSKEHEIGSLVKLLDKVHEDEKRELVNTDPSLKYMEVCMHADDPVNGFVFGPAQTIAEQVQTTRQLLAMEGGESRVVCGSGD